MNAARFYKCIRLYVIYSFLTRYSLRSKFLFSCIKPRFMNAAERIY